MLRQRYAAGMFESTRSVFLYGILNKKKTNDFSVCAEIFPAFFDAFILSGYAAPITRGGASRRGTAVTFGWWNNAKLLPANRLKASPTSTELIMDSRRAVRRMCGFWSAFFK